MAGIWRKDGDKWSLVGPSDFSNEEELHDRIVEAPEMLPLSGQPQIVAPYREVPLGGGSADVLAFEASGRPVVIEVKLSRNAEARRAVVAQALAYAAALHGATVEELETDILPTHLEKDDHARLADAIEADAIDSGAFYENLAEHLAEGSFRIVFVLDEAPPQLVKLAGYLEVIADRITVDLVTVRAYTVNGAQILLPQRIDPEHVSKSEAPSGRRRSTSAATLLTDSSERFRSSLDDLSSERKETLTQLADWADNLAAEGLCRVLSFQGKGRFTLLPRLRGDDAGLAVIWNDSSSKWDGVMTLNRSVIERRAPKALPRIEAVVAPIKVGRGTAAMATPELLDALAEGYREAAGKE